MTVCDICGKRDARAVTIKIDGRPARTIAPPDIGEPMRDWQRDDAGTFDLCGACMKYASANAFRVGLKSLVDAAGDQPARPRTTPDWCPNFGEIVQSLQEDEAKR